MSENVNPGQSAWGSGTGKRHPSGPPRPRQTNPPDTRRRIQEFINKLVNIYDVVEATKLPFLEPTDHRSLSIDCQELKLNSDGSYASPRPQPCFFNATSPHIVNHPVEFKNEESEMKRHYERTGRKLKRCMDDPSTAYSSTDLLSNTLGWEFCQYPRKGLEEDLSSHTNWRQSGYVNDLQKSSS